MILSKTLTLPDTELLSLDATPGQNEEPRATLLLQTRLTPKLAEQLGFRDLVYLENGAPRSFFTRIELDTELDGVSVDVDQFALRLSPRSVNGFSVKRHKEGYLKLVFKIKTDGFVPLLGELFSSVNAKTFALEINSAQQKLDFASGEEEEAVHA